MHNLTIRLDDRLALQLGEAAQAIGISKATIYRRIADGSLPSTRVGGRRLVLRDDLLALLNGGRREQPS